MRGEGGATRIASTARSRRARCAAHIACVPGSPWSLARLSASEEAGRWLAPASRSSRARTSRAAGRRMRASGASAIPHGDREQDDAGDPQRPRRELPRPKPGGGEKENDDRERKHERRPRALDDEHALRQSRKRAKPAPVRGAEGLLVRILHRDAVIRCRQLDISVLIQFKAISGPAHLFQPAHAG